MDSKAITFIKFSGYYFLACILSLFVTFILNLPNSEFFIKSIIVGLLYGLLNYYYFKNQYSFLFVIIVAIPVVSMKFVLPLNWVALIQYILIFMGIGSAIIFLLRKKLIS